MSLNRKITLKIVRGEEIRVMHLMPSTWAEMQESLNNMYGSSNFHITYLDEEGDHITIGNDMDLEEAYNFYSGKPSMKLYLKPKNVPEEYEELKTEDPNEKKPDYGQGGQNWGQWAEWGENAWARCARGFGGRGGRGGRCRGMWDMLRGAPWGGKMKKQMRKMWKEKSKVAKGYKMKILQKSFPKRWVVSCGSTIVITWSVMNKGQFSWTEGSLIENFNGTLKLLEPVYISEVRPGEVCNISINVQVPIDQGKHNGVWGLLVNGECAGILRAKVYASAETNNAKVETLISMGFTREIAMKALEENGGDLDLAVSNILHS